MVAPTFKKVTDTAPGNAQTYGAQDLKYAFDVLDGTHPTDRLQQINIEGINQNFGYNAIVRNDGGTYRGYREDGVALSVPSSASAHLVLQSAIDWVSSIGGGKVFIKNGTYTITNQWELPNNVIITGESRDNCILRSASGLSLAQVDNTDATNGNNHIMIENLTLDHTDVPTDTGTSILNFTKVEHSVLYNIHFKNPSNGTALTMDGNSVDQLDNVIAFCFLDGSGRSPKPTQSHMVILDDFCDSLFVNNIIKDAGGSAGNAGVRALRAKRSVFGNNVVWNCAFTGIMLQQSSECAVSNNMVHNNGEYGIYFAGATNTLRCSATQNICRLNGQKGMHIEGNDLLISCNVCSDNDESGIDMVGADRCLVSQNLCRNNGKDTAATPTDRRAGIRLSGGSDTNLVSANKCHDDQGVKTQVYGISEDTGTSTANSSISNNHVIGNLTAGCLLTGTGTQARFNLGFNPQGVTTQSTPSTGNSYTNNDRVPEAIYLRGGTGIDIVKNGITVSTGTPCTIWLEPGEAFTITYSGTVTMVKDRK